MAEVIWSLASRQQLRDIFDYIRGHNTAAADRTITGILTRIEQIAEYPRIGHRIEWIEHAEVRSLNFGHYRIAYRLISESRLEIMAIFHGARDIRDLLS